MKKYGILGFWKVGSCGDRSMFDALLLFTSFYADTAVCVISHYFTLPPSLPLLPSSAAPWWPRHSSPSRSHALSTKSISLAYKGQR